MLRATYSASVRADRTHMRGGGRGAVGGSDQGRQPHQFPRGAACPCLPALRVRRLLAGVHAPRSGRRRAPGQRARGLPRALCRGERRRSRGGPCAERAVRRRRGGPRGDAGPGLGSGAGLGVPRLAPAAAARAVSALEIAVDTAYFGRGLSYRMLAALKAAAARQGYGMRLPKTSSGLVRAVAQGVRGLGRGCSKWCPGMALGRPGMMAGCAAATGLPDRDEHLRDAAPAAVERPGQGRGDPRAAPSDHGAGTSTR